MGRWVTSKGRRIYILDEGEENPFKEGFKKKKEIQDIADKHNKKVWNGGAANKELYDEADKFAESHNFNKEKTRDAAFAAFNEKWVDSVKRKQEGKDPIDKEESTKQKQIAANKAQADELNGKKYAPLTKEEHEVATKYIKENEWVHNEVNRQLKAGEDWDKVMRQVHGAAEKYGKKDTWHSETPNERKEFLRRKEVAHSLGLKNDVLGQLATDRYTPEGLKDAVKRGWITQEQADKINGKKRRKG